MSSSGAKQKERPQGLIDRNGRVVCVHGNSPERRQPTLSVNSPMSDIGKRKNKASLDFWTAEVNNLSNYA